MNQGQKRIGALITALQGVAVAFLGSRWSGCTSGDLGKALKGRSGAITPKPVSSGLDTRPTVAKNRVRAEADSGHQPIPVYQGPGCRNLIPPHTDECCGGLFA